jgi:hypothetical protein
MKTTLTIAGIAVAALIFAMILNVGIDKSEMADCMKWAGQADAYPAFYLTQWQADQCKAHHIIINATVK